VDAGLVIVDGGGESDDGATGPHSCKWERQTAVTMLPMTAVPNTQANGRAKRPVPTTQVDAR